MANGFQPSPNREAAMQALRKGMSIKECIVKFDISQRTAYRYLAQISYDSFSKKVSESQQSTKLRRSPIKITIEMEFEDVPELLERIRKVVQI